MTYTLMTTDELEFVLGVAAKSVGQPNQQVLNNILTQTLATLEENQRQGFLGTIAQNDGIETLQQLAEAAPNSNAVQLSNVQGGQQP